MAPPPLRALSCAAVLAAACYPGGVRDAATAVPAASSRAPAASDQAPGALPTLAARIDGRDVPLRFGRAVFDGELLRVELSALPVPCDADDQAYRDALSFALPAGPGAGFYRGATIDLRAEVRTAARAQGFVRITTTIARAGAAPGDLVAGNLEVDARMPGTEGYLIHAVQARGAFGARVCARRDASDPRGRGPVAGQAFAYRRAFASLAIDPVSGERAITALEFTSDPQARCDRRSDAPVLTLGELSGARTGRPVLGQAQPAEPQYYVREPGDPCPGSSVGIPGGPRAWVTFDALAFQPGATVSGRAEHTGVDPVEAPGTAPGRFVATVCPPR